MKLCRCGAVVKDRCERCSPKIDNRGTTKERGYGNDWRKLSERYRKEFPLCQVCLLSGRVQPAEHTHHIEKIVDAPELRLDKSNLLSVCEACHEIAERDKALAIKAKMESKYERFVWLDESGEVAD